MSTRQSSVLPLLLAVALLFRTASVHALSCRAPNAALMPFCGGTIDYQIDSTSDEATLDGDASYWAGQYGQSTDYGSICPMWATTRFQCKRYFPECILTIGTVTNTTRLNKICEASCLQASTANDGACLKSFTSAHITSECDPSNNGAFYSANQPCADVSAPNTDLIVGSGTWWRIVLGVGVGVIAIISLCLLWRHSRKESISAEDLEARDNKKMAKLQAAKAKREEEEKKKEEKRRAKEAKKNGGRGAVYATSSPEASNEAHPVAEEIGRIELVITEPGGTSSKPHSHHQPHAVAVAVAVATPASADGEPHSAHSHHDREKKHKHHHHHSRRPAALSKGERTPTDDGQPHSAHSARSAREKAPLGTHSFSGKALTPAARQMAEKRRAGSLSEGKKQHEGSDSQPHSATHPEMNPRSSRAAAAAEGSGAVRLHMAPSDSPPLHPVKSSSHKVAHPERPEGH
jgi:hypothetical protein